MLRRGAAVGARWGRRCVLTDAHGGQITVRSQGLPDFIEKWGRGPFYKFGAFGTLCSVGLGAVAGPWVQAPVGLLVAAYWVQGYRDINSSHALRRNFPVLANVRYILESFRPEVRQYFLESDFDAVPFDRVQRSTIYQRAKGVPDTQAFGTRRDVYGRDYEWAKHSMWPAPRIPEEEARVLIGGKATKEKYSAALLNVSGMSYGALSDNAVLALNSGAKMGNFYHNTGEGGISRFHLEPGGDLVWNIGTGYFGCRDSKGNFCPEMFKDRAAQPQVKMIEVKLSQGAKPGKGGMLPKAKITPLIAEARGIELGQDCMSPSRHSAFSGPRGLVEFIARLRELSGGKPIGFKLCMGHPEEFMALCHAMLELGIAPDFITVDGSEGGTGAAPPEFSSRVGTPLVDGLVTVDRVLRGAGLREEVKIICSGKVVTGFDVVRNLALGAGVCNAARAMMFALGCIQSLKCDTNKCPTGITTLNKDLMSGLHVPYKSERVRSYQAKTVSAALDIVAAMGLTSHTELAGQHIMRRINPTNIASYADIYPCVKPGALVHGTGPELLVKAWNNSKILLDKRVGDLHREEYVPVQFGADMSSRMTRLLTGAPPPGQTRILQ